MLSPEQTVRSACTEVTEHSKWGGMNLCYLLLRGLNWPSMRDKLQRKNLQSAYSDMHNPSLKTKSPQVTVQNISAENTDAARLPTHQVDKSKRWRAHSCAKTCDKEGVVMFTHWCKDNKNESSLCFWSTTDYLHINFSWSWCTLKILF